MVGFDLGDVAAALAGLPPAAVRGGVTRVGLFLPIADLGLAGPALVFLEPALDFVGLAGDEPAGVSLGAVMTEATRDRVVAMPVLSTALRGDAAVFLAPTFVFFNGFFDFVEAFLPGELGGVFGAVEVVVVEVVVPFLPIMCNGFEGLGEAERDRDLDLEGDADLERDLDLDVDDVVVLFLSFNFLSSFGFTLYDALIFLRVPSSTPRFRAAFKWRITVASSGVLNVFCMYFLMA